MTETSAAPSIAHDKPPAILSLIGDTPLVEITQFDTGPCQLFLKLENQNPGGSIKDRIALSMIEAAEADGKLQPGGTVVEATAGNTGLGLALVAGAKGYRVLLVIPDKMSQEKISHVKALGAEVRISRSDVTRGHPEYYQDVAARLAEEIPGAFYVNQFGNPANPLAHERTTGPEIWEQMRHDVDAIVVGVGSGGTLTGLGRFFNRVKPRRGIEMVLADPAGSILYEYVKTGKLVESGTWAVEGIGEDFIPEIADMSLVTEAFEIDDANKYLSKMYNDFWMAEQGFIHRPPHGDLSDLISHRYEAGEVITVGPDDSLLTAFKRMRDSDVSQLPVVDQKGRAIGIIDESDLLVKVHRAPSHFNDPVEKAMTDRLETLPPTATIKDLLDVFDRGRVAIVMDDDKFLGLVTRTDLLSYLRLHMPKQ